MKNTNHNYENLTTDDISLAEILKGFTNFIKKYFQVLAISLLLGALVGFMYFKFTKPSYESTLTAYANHISDVRVRDMIKDLNKMIKENDAEQLAQSLSIPLNTAQKIGGFSVAINAELNKDKDERDAKSGNSFSITATVSTNTILDTLQQGLNNYLSNNPHIALLKKMGDTATINQIAKIEKEIAYLDSLKREIRTQIRKGNNMQVLDPSAISARILDLNSQMFGLRNGLALQENELVITAPFVPFKKQASPRLIISVVSGTVVGLLVGLIAAVALSFKRKD